MTKVDWNLRDLPPPAAGAPKVFSCFHCGGGSSMGYKRAGFEVVGGVEIDPKMMEIYRTNHKPRLSFLMGVQDFNKLPDDKIPAELFKLDVLDGSPPCSSFSMSGPREKKWGKKTVFREGQAMQRLDDLFFDFIAIAKRLQPKVVIAENVTGLLKGRARGYVKEILAAFSAAGYDVQLFTLNAATMGVPQLRVRVFFVARRRDLALPKIALEFKEQPIRFSEIDNKLPGKSIGVKMAALWRLRLPTDTGILEASVRNGGKPSYFNWRYARPDAVLPTQTATLPLVSWHTPSFLHPQNIIRGQTFPQDFNFVGNHVHYVCGMSVPPFMMERIARQVRRQWLSDN